MRLACFRRPPTTTPAGPTVTTSIYETHAGLAALTWSRTVLGLSLRVDLRLPSPTSSSFSSSSSASSVPLSDALTFRLRPSFLRRRGSKRFHLPHKSLLFSWDLSRSPPSLSPEPSGSFFVSISVDGDLLAVVGDVALYDVFTRSKVPVPASRGSPRNPILLSRCERVVLPAGGGDPYTTTATMGGKERKISIDLGGEKDARLCVGLDGERSLQVKRLRWKFRGNERFEPAGSDGSGILVSWDVHDWLFPKKPENPVEPAQAVLVFRFDRNDDSTGKSGVTPPWGGGGYGWGYFGNNDFRKKSLVKTNSGSSSSSVMSWESAEETELKDSDGFFLVVYISRQ